MYNFLKSISTELKKYSVMLTGVISVNGIYAYSDSVNGFMPVNGELRYPIGGGFCNGSF